MNLTEAPLDALSAIIPGTTISNDAQPAFLLGFTIVLFCNFTTTYNHPFLPYLRLALASPAYYACWLYGFSGQFVQLNRSVALGMALLGTYGGMKVTEICVVGFWNGQEDWPKWVKLRTETEKKAGASQEKQTENRMGEVIPFEPTILGRLVYAHDLGSASGASWLAGRAWSWATPGIRNQDPTPQPRWQFVFTSVTKLIGCYLIMDVCESISATRSWDLYTPNTRPVTGSGIPLKWQLVYATCVCIRTAMGITFPHTVFALVAGLTINAPSTGFRPLFDAPWASRSLAEFWSVRWHPIFRRSFDQISSGILSIIVFVSGSGSRSSKPLAKQSRIGKNSTITMNTTGTQPLSQFEAVYPPALVPPAAQPFFQLIVISLILCNFTVTYNHPILPYLRLVLAIPVLYGSWSYGLSGAFDPMPNRKVAMGMGYLATHGIMKAFEVCIIGFWNKEEDWPKWVKLQTEGETKGGKGEIVPFTPTILGRLAYALDLGSAGGSSWFRGRAWDWATPTILNQRAQPLPRFQFVLRSLITLIQSFLIVDVCESIIATRNWNTTLSQPLTNDGIPMLLQLVYATCVCARTMIGSMSAYTGIGMLCALVFNTPSTAFPPLFDHPFASRSLAEFWASKWHPILRRSLHTISAGIFSLFIFIFSSSSDTALILTRRDVKLLRSVIIFALSCLVHLVFWNAIPTNPTYPYPSFFNAEGIKFFLLQPLGLTIELLLIRPLTEDLPDGRWGLKTVVRRGFAWTWLLWSGRFFSNVWINRGLLGHAEREIVYSPVRGVLRGQWRID
ncbi:hypothetical protein FRB97_007003 [Tulasnella sp. 331]|nr:hypothetical protein FRB97_007003 [Tulasnella sp. 331]